MFLYTEYEGTWFLISTTSVTLLVNGHIVDEGWADDTVVYSTNLLELASPTMDPAVLPGTVSIRIFVSKFICANNSNQIFMNSKFSLKVDHHINEGWK